MDRLRSWTKPGVAGGVAVALILSLLFGAVAFSIAQRTVNVADVGTVAIYEEASLSAAAATRNRVVQSHLMARAETLDVATIEDVDASMTSAEGAIGELRARIDRLIVELGTDPVGEDVSTLASRFEADAIATMEMLRVGELDDAELNIESALESSYRSLADTLAAARNDAVTQMELSRNAAGRIGDAASFLVALLLPITFVLAYRTRVQNQQRRRDLEASLERQQAIARTKDEFIANLSHELRTPLTGIYGFALELIEGSHDPSMALELARLIAGQSAELSRMVEDLLTLNTAEHNELIVNLEVVDPQSEIAEVIEPLRRTGIIAVSQAESAAIEADALRLRQIVRNLVSNAHRHGGPHIRVVGEASDEIYTIQVRDDGAGVPEELEDKLFTRFIHDGTTPLITGSVGLGLSIASLLTERMGGHISYYREDGETVFAVAFPRAPEEAVPNRPDGLDAAGSFVAGL